MTQSQTKGVALATSAYLIWGFFPLYFDLLRSVSPLEILAQRIIWSLIVTLGLSVFLGLHYRWGRIIRHPRQIALLGLSATLIGINWLVYLWAVNQHQVVASSLGYFMSPVVSLILARVFFKETLHPLQRLAGGLALLSIGWEVVILGYFPWISLVLALAFSLYGVVRKYCKIDSINGMTIETLWLLFPALLWISLQPTATLSFATTPVITALLMGSGLISALPLVLFSMAARRIDLSIIGFLMMLNPTMQFLIGVCIFHEPFPIQRIVTFILIWLAMACFLTGMVKKHRTT